MKIKPSYLIYPAVFLSVSIICIFYFSYKPSIREGKLSFYRNNKIFKKISVQAIETNQWRTQDLIHKNSMPDSHGMLFIFIGGSQMPFAINKRNHPFDFIFITDNNKIVIIQKNIPPSQTQIKLCDDIIAYKYALVVNEDFCNTYSISEDDSIAFNLK